MDDIDKLAPGLIRTITIERYDFVPGGRGIDGMCSGWTVREGDRYIDALTWDELVGQIASMTFPAGALNKGGIFHQQMLTAAEHRARDERSRRGPDWPT